MENVHRSQSKYLNLVTHTEKVAPLFRRPCGSSRTGACCTYGRARKRPAAKSTVRNNPQGTRNCPVTTRRRCVDRRPSRLVDGTEAEGLTNLSTGVWLA